MKSGVTAHDSTVLRGRSSADIARDLTEIRREIDDTLTLLEYRLSPRQLLYRTRARGAAALHRISARGRRNAMLTGVAALVSTVVVAVVLMRVQRRR